MNFETAYNSGLEKAESYKHGKSNPDLYFEGKTHIVFIETNIYAGNFEQEICESVFGYEYSEDIRSSSIPQSFIEKMESIGYAPEYFWNMSDSCMHEEYGSVIANIIPTPNVVNEKYPGYPVYNTVVLFFNQEIEKKDIETIFNISKEIVKKLGGNILAIGQYLKV